MTMVNLAWVTPDAGRLVQEKGLESTTRKNPDLSPSSLFLTPVSETLSINTYYSLSENAASKSKKFRRVPTPVPGTGEGGDIIVMVYSSQVISGESTLTS